MQLRGSLEQPPIIVRGSRFSKQSLMLLAPAPFTLIWVVSLSLQPLRGVPVWLLALTVLFSLLSVLAIWNFISPLRLELSPTGIDIHAMWRRRHLAWADVRNFRPVVYLSSKAVGYDYGDTHPRSATQTLVSTTTGADALLVVGMEIDDTWLSGLLNEAWARWSGASGSPGQPSASLTAARPNSPGRFVAYLLAFIGGRANRSLYWAAIGVCLTVAAVVAITFRNAGWVGACVLTGFTLAVGARLGDLGRSPRWAVLGLVIVPFLFLIAMVVTSNAYVAIAAGALSAVLFVVWMGIPAGDPQPNRFGARPGWHETQARGASETFN